MTDAIELLQKSIEAKPAEMEHQLATAMRSVGKRIVQAPEIVRALTAAESLRRGLVIESDEHAAAVADLVAQVIDGERRLAAETAAAMRIPKQMTAAVKGAVDPTATALSVAKVVGNDAGLAWKAELRRRAATETARQEQVAREAAARAAAEAEAVGEDVPPIAEIAPVEAPRVVSGGVGKVGTQVRIAAVEIVNIASVPPEWLQLIPAVAVAVFNSAVLEKKLKRPIAGESILWNGVRFEAREHAVNRR